MNEIIKLRKELEFLKNKEKEKEEIKKIKQEIKNIKKKNNMFYKLYYEILKVK